MINVYSTQIQYYVNLALGVWLSIFKTEHIN